jgi:hypothetical protein
MLKKGCTNGRSRGAYFEGKCWESVDAVESDVWILVVMKDWRDLGEPLLKTERIWDKII